MSAPGPATPVYVFGEHRVPTYHESTGWHGRLSDRHIRTRCGLIIIEWRDTLGYIDLAKRLRRDWAEQIGRPCQKCGAP